MHHLAALVVLPLLWLTQLPLARSAANGGLPRVVDSTGTPLAYACWMDASSYDPAKFAIAVTQRLRIFKKLPVGYNDVVVQVVGRATTLPTVGAQPAPWTWSPPLQTPVPPKGGASTSYKYVQLRWYIVGPQSQVAMSGALSSLNDLEALTKCTRTVYAPRFVVDPASFQNVPAFNDGFYLLVGGVTLVVSGSILVWLVRETRCCDCLWSHPAMVVVQAVAKRTGLATLYHATEKRKKMDDEADELAEFLDGRLNVPTVDQGDQGDSTTDEGSSATLSPPLPPPSPMRGPARARGATARAAPIEL